ncbi:hypothetical protein F2Q69_00033811 [Brassica cretica]|uniref:S-locus receptor kinase C-terminal domain-containing protein n=1 Tax=Brassica cretica TaxID=69181 RepID=A0A8S9SR83_BRACR|nr:hypothetical protein F2Q69_00033811 [Brassica cretica]
MCARVSSQILNRGSGCDNGGENDGDNGGEITVVLEIINGKRNSSFTKQTAWRVWRNGSPFELVDPDVGESCDSNEVTRFIHIALLCVQENPKDRPTLSTTIIMLTSNTITLPVPHNLDFTSEAYAIKT